MFKVLVWDYMGVGVQWLKQFADMKDVKIVGTINPKEHVPDIFLDKNAWDWLLIFEQGTRVFFENIIRIAKVSPDKVIYALDKNSWLQHPKAAFALMDMRRAEGLDILLRIHLSINRQLNKFVTCTVEGVSYTTSPTDLARMNHMYISRLNWASNDMKNFHKLAHKYYNVDDSSGYFLDLGANIGTTGIYFTKKLAPNLKLLAFEPDPENFKMHTINMILNDVAEKTDLVNCGLGNEADELMLYRNDDFNSGMNSFIKHKQSKPIATIKIIPLDSYFAEKKISAQEVKYIWIDTEGFEAQVLLGAKNLLRENPAPIFMECNLRAWDKSGFFEDMMALLEESYSHFIHFFEGEKIYPIEALRTMSRPDDSLGQMRDIFLIKKGAID